MDTDDSYQLKVVFLDIFSFPPLQSVPARSTLPMSVIALLILEPRTRIACGADEVKGHQDVCVWVGGGYCFRRKNVPMLGTYISQVATDFKSW